MICGACSSSVAVTKAVNPEMSARTRMPSWVFHAHETPQDPVRETGQGPDCGQAATALPAGVA